VGEIKKCPPSFDLKTKQAGRDEVYMHEYVYLTVTAEKDTVLGFLIHTK